MTRATSRLLWVIGLAASLLLAQTPPTPPNAVPLKELVLGTALAKQIEQRDGLLTDAAALTYVQGLANKLASSAVAAPLQVRVTKSTMQYAILLPGHILYLSSGLFLRMKTESELAAILAHEQGHKTVFRILNATQPQSIALFMGDCVLTAPSILWLAPASWVATIRQSEVEANVAAVRSLRAADYDPESLFVILSKLAHEHQGWEKALTTNDLESGLSKVEAEPLPAEGYIADTSTFAALHDHLERIIGVSRNPLPLKPAHAPSLLRDP